MKILVLNGSPRPNGNTAGMVKTFHQTAVETAQGDVLHTNLPNAPHGEGDYLVCMIGEDGGPDLSDV